MYAFVDVVDYQKVVVTDASSGIKKAAENYLNDIGEEVTNAETKEKEITITNIKDVIIDSNTYYYITDSENKNYKVSIKTNKDLLPFINNGDIVKIKYEKESNVTLIKEISK